MKAATLKLGRWEKVLADVARGDCLMADPPYSERVHKGHDDGANLADKQEKHRKKNGVLDTTKPRRKISYAFWTPADVDAFIDSWAPRISGWFVCLSDSELCGVYRAAYERNGLTGFQPVPIVITGMTVRRSGDGPSSWAIYANVGRPKSLCRWGTLPGAYVGTVGQRERKAAAVAGAKPLWAMRALVRDYTRPGDLVVDPCAGGATTLIAAAIEGRKAIGAEVDKKTFGIAQRRLAAGYTPALDFGEAA